MIGLWPWSFKLKTFKYLATSSNIYFSSCIFFFNSVFIFFFSFISILLFSFFFLMLLLFVRLGENYAVYTLSSLSFFVEVLPFVFVWINDFSLLLLFLWEFRYWRVSLIGVDLFLIKLKVSDFFFGVFIYLFSLAFSFSLIFIFFLWFLGVIVVIDFFWTREVLYFFIDGYCLIDTFAIKLSSPSSNVILFLRRNSKNYVLFCWSNSARSTILSLFFIVVSSVNNYKTKI